MKKIIQGICAVLLCSAAGWANAQNFPVKSLRMVIHFPPGGPTDLVGRAMAQKLTELWKQQIMVENRPGAGGVIGIETVLRAPPDGYTLLFGTGGSLALAPALNPKLPYNVFTDLAPITLVVINPQILVVHPSLPVHNVRELIKLAKSKPGQINYASVGPGSPNHMGMELLKSMAGIDMVHIPYKGSGPSNAAFLSGEVQVLFSSITAIVPHVNAGRVRALAVTGPKRSQVSPNTPTVSEAGLPGYEVTGWYGLIAPAKTPAASIERLNAEANRALPSLKDRYAEFGSEIVGGTAREFGDFLAQDIAKWAKVVKISGARPD